MIAIVFTLLAGTILVSGEASAQSPAPTTDERLRLLEKRLQELEAREAEVFTRSVNERGRVKTFLNDTISFGGFFESDLLGLTGPDTPPQVSIQSNTLGLNVTADFNERIRFVSQILTGLAYVLANPHNDARATPPQRQFSTTLFGALVAQAYSEMLVDEALNLQVGLGYVPYGFGFQQREPVLFRRRGGPQMIQSTSSRSVGIAHPLWMGVHVHGSKRLEGLSRFGYSLYTHSPLSDPKTLGLGTRLWSAISDDTTVGFSIQNGSMTGGSYTSYGFDVDRHAAWGGFTSEYAKNFRSDGAEIAESGYVEPFVNFAPGWLGFVVADYLENPFNVTSPGTTLDPIEKWIYGAGVNWLPIPYSRFRVGYYEHRYVGATAMSGGQKRDHERYELSAGIAF